MGKLSVGVQRAYEMRLKSKLLGIVVALSLAPGAFAQACALCYTTASQTSIAAQRSLDWGILALVTPALAMFVGVILMLYRRSASAAA
jgi:hypothetical protein